ncbi:E3 ubiquitin-protein ligase rnf38 [Clonorchis sinensis]|uniref:E3 ubiquitin-protein ligase rnf38 n=1 Tax=Clonorchis sinensis TaxID=79923 RepID=A0A8T1MYJ6_CLOSI|nr:E3 ubiquitin-protein ligase rnf38 [Clonorchis sinensis]
MLRHYLTRNMGAAESRISPYVRQRLKAEISLHIHFDNPQLRMMPKKMSDAVGRRVYRQALKDLPSKYLNSSLKELPASDLLHLRKYIREVFEIAAPESICENNLNHLTETRRQSIAELPQVSSKVHVSSKSNGKEKSQYEVLERICTYKLIDGIQLTQCPECPICLCDFIEMEMVLVLPCTHLFHGECVELWLNRGGADCPLCRYVFFENRKKSITVVGEGRHYVSGVYRPEEE